MPNICYTTVRFYGDTDNIALLENKLQAAQAIQDDSWLKDHVDFDPWIGSLVLALGGCVANIGGGCVCRFTDGQLQILPTLPDGEPDIPCRGRIDYWELVQNDDGMLDISISFHEAWRPHPELYDYIAKQCGGLSYMYVADEHGGGLHIATDPALVQEEAAYLCHGNVESYYGIGEGDRLLNDVSWATGKYVGTVKEAMQVAKECHIECYAYENPDGNYFIRGAK